MVSLVHVSTCFSWPPGPLNVSGQVGYSRRGQVSSLATGRHLVEFSRRLCKTGLEDKLLGYASRFWKAVVYHPQVTIHLVTTRTLSTHSINAAPSVTLSVRRRSKELFTPSGPAPTLGRHSTCHQPTPPETLGHNASRS